jgi:hypothetical protein
MDQLEKYFENLFLKKISWQLPTKAREVIVKIAPWVTLIVLIVSIPAVLVIFGIGSVATGLAAYSGVFWGGRYYLSLIVLIIELVLMAMSISGLIKRELRGWKLVYYGELVSVVYAIISAYSLGNLISSLIGAAIGLYVVFQIKSYYR